MKAVRTAGQFIVIVALFAGVAALSDWPSYGQIPKNTGVLMLTFVHGADRKGECRRLTPEEIANFPHKNVIVRALGMKDTVKVDTRFEVPQARDTYLLCSDGLSGPVEDPQMLEIINRYSSDLKLAASKMIEEALGAAASRKAGGR